MAHTNGNAPGPDIRVDHHDGYGTADLHMHTDHSDGMASVSAVLEYVEHRTNLDVIAITDHDTLDGSFAARELAAGRDYSFEVVMGNEITTLSGHLLALFIEKPVKSLQPLNRTIAAVHDQGGLCIVPHPMSWLTRSIGRRALDRVMSNSAGGRFDGIETYNPTLAGRVVSGKVRSLNKSQYHLAETGGSDAHFLPAVGSGYTIFPGSGAEGLLRALQEKTTVAGGFREPSLREIGLGQIVAQQVRSLLVLPTRRVGQKASRMMRSRRPARTGN